jgi:hypothetical protein
LKQLARTMKFTDFQPNNRASTCRTAGQMNKQPSSFGNSDRE